MSFPDAKLDADVIADRLGVFLTDKGVGATLREVTAEVSDAAARTSSWAGAIRMARRIARYYAKSERYMHAVIAGLIADEYQWLRENQ